MNAAKDGSWVDTLAWEAVCGIANVRHRSQVINLQVLCLFHSVALLFTEPDHVSAISEAGVDDKRPSTCFVLLLHTYPERKLCILKSSSRHPVCSHCPLQFVFVCPYQAPSAPKLLPLENLYLDVLQASIP